MAKILVIGAAGQLGIELVLALQNHYGVDSVDVSDIRVPDDEGVMRSRFLHVDATDEGAVHKVLESQRTLHSSNVTSFRSCKGAPST